MTRQWVRVTSGKYAGQVGYIEREAFPRRGIALIVMYSTGAWLTKQARTFTRLTEAECAAMEMRG
jgi:hypothetical protein